MELLERCKGGSDFIVDPDSPYTNVKTACEKVLILGNIAATTGCNSVDRCNVMTI